MNLVTSRYSRELSAVQRSRVAELHAATAATPAQRRAAEAKALKLRLWASLPVVAGEDPSYSRMCGRYRILWSEFGTMTECGWHVERDEIVSFFATKYGP